MPDEAEQFDVVVVGAGPGGATAATLIAMRGHRVLLLEKERLPLYKIGESLLPSTIHGVCAMLGVSEELKAAGFVRKAGGTFRWGKNKQPWTFSFSASPRFAGPTSYAYQVERMKFDAILVDNARRKGVEVREAQRVTEAIVENDRVTGVRVVTDRGEPLTVRARYVVDASGNESLLARHAGERVLSEFFRNLAVFGYFRNGGRLPAPNAGNIFCAAFEIGWIWYIPLSAELTSVGAVIGHEHAALLRKDKEAALTGLIADCEPMRNLLANATRVTDGPYGEVRVRKDFSYCHTAFWRPGLVLVGDAACFIDPVFSSGVHLATYSGLLAARSINTALSDPSSEDQAFTEFQRRYLREYRYFHDFLRAFYDVDQDLDGYYWAARKTLGSSEVGAEAFIQLVGGLGGSGELLDHAGLDTPVSTATATTAPTSTDGLAKALFPLAEGTENLYVYARENKSRPGQQHTHGGGHDTRDAFMANLTAEGAQIQMQALKLGLPRRPLFEGGLVPSDDGLQWTAAAAVDARS
jgi:FAD-dependent halogenase